MNATDVRTIVAFWVVGCAVLTVVLVANHLRLNRREKAELARLERARELQRERYTAGTVAAAIRNARRRQTAAQVEQTHDLVQKWLGDALRARDAAIVAEFERHLAELPDTPE